VGATRILEKIMLSMHLGIKRLQASAVAALLAGVLPGHGVASTGLTLEAAEALALGNDPGIRAVEASRQALEELSVAEGQLPDPMLKMGLVSLPTDSFRLGREPMTQLQVGVVQKFPRGDTRELRAAQAGLKSESLGAVALDQALQVALAVREHFLEVMKQQALARINAEAIASFADVADITQDYYATGRVQQQDVLQASVELARVQDRATRIAQDEEQARTRLAAWIGNAAYQTLDGSWPEFADPRAAGATKDGLPRHPRVQALQKRGSASETGIELARQQYKPEFALDLTYGGRGGENPDGSSRSDLLTFMVVMDIPLFTDKRQDRVVASRAAESSAAMFTRDDELRRLRSEVDFHAATYARQHERIELFENTLLPEASFSSEAALQAYQSSIADLTTLLRTRITEFDLQLEHARLQAELLKTRARLQYLEGA
jgi:outer membrane protein TolC